MDEDDDVDAFTKKGGNRNKKEPALLHVVLPSIMPFLPQMVPLNQALKGEGGASSSSSAASGSAAGAANNNSNNNPDDPEGDAAVADPSRLMKARMAALPTGSVGKVRVSCVCFARLLLFLFVYLISSSCCLSFVCSSWSRPLGRFSFTSAV
jgi:hypothetical protein